MAPDSLLELKNVVKHYESPGGMGPQVLKGVDLRILPGETVAVVGPSGSGKTTLLNIIGALDRPTSGRVQLEGADLASLKEEELSHIRNRKIGFVFQLHHLLPQCTVLENVLVPALVDGDASAIRQKADRAHRLLERAGLGDRLKYRPGHLSGGERQRVALVRALINSPQLLLADEPTGSLDRSGSDRMADLLVELNREEGTALIIVTHAENLAERMDRLFELRDGLLVLREASI
jgi:ABC-type lipoprotein export system ATPase subunit